MGAPVFLCGMMGSGKSSVGRALASAVGAGFVDLDTRIERMFGESIPRAFSRGEAYFRALERASLLSLVGEAGFGARLVIVATGGGAVVDPQNRAQMDSVGVRVFLRVPLPQLVARLAGDGDVRPLVADAEDPLTRLAEVWQQRRAAYEGCAHAVDGAGSVSVVAHRIAAVLDLDLQTGETPTPV